MAKILFFGITGDLTGTGEISYSCPDLDSLRQALETDFPKLRNAKFRFAVNGEIKNGNVCLSDNDIVALLPPFAGG